MKGGTSDSELQRVKDELKAALERRGVISSLKSRIRSEIYHCIDAAATGESNVATVDADTPHENVIINELIREYLIFNGYTSTLSVFLPESRQPKQPALERLVLESELGLHGTDPQEPRAKLPLLYTAVSKLRRASTAQVVGTASDLRTTSGFLSTNLVSTEAESTARSGGDVADDTRPFQSHLDDLDNPLPVSFKNI